MLIKNCEVRTFFCDGSVFFPRGGVEYKQYSFGKKCCEALSMQHISNMQTQVLESTFLTHGKWRQTDYLSRELL